jgi:hypothetical protein
MDIETLNIADVEPNQIRVRKPKVDKSRPTTHFAKARYTDKDLRLYVYVYDALVVKHNLSDDRSVLFFKTSADVQKTIASIDDYMVQSIIQNKATWFSHAQGLEENMLEEYYVRSIVCGGNGTIVKLKLKKDESDSQSGIQQGRYNFMMYLRGMRMHKAYCYLEWELVECKPSKPPYFTLADETTTSATSTHAHHAHAKDDGGSSKYDALRDDQDIVPSFEDLKDIHESLLSTIQSRNEAMMKRVDKLQLYEDALKELEKSGFEIRQINEIAEKLEDEDES